MLLRCEYTVSAWGTSLAFVTISIKSHWAAVAYHGRHTVSHTAKIISFLAPILRYPLQNGLAICIVSAPEKYLSNQNENSTYDPNGEVIDSSYISQAVIVCKTFSTYEILLSLPDICFVRSSSEPTRSTTLQEKLFTRFDVSSKYKHFPTVIHTRTA